MGIRNNKVGEMSIGSAKEGNSFFKKELTYICFNRLKSNREFELL